MDKERLGSSFSELGSMERILRSRNSANRLRGRARAQVMRCELLLFYEE